MVKGLCSIFLFNKLEGVFNYRVWWIYIIIIFKEKKLWYYLCFKEIYKIIKIVEVLKEFKRGKINVNKNKKYNIMIIIILLLKDNVLYYVLNIF